MGNRPLSTPHGSLFQFRDRQGALVAIVVGPGDTGSAEHDYMYHRNQGGYGIVQCRRCREFRSYRLVGYKPEPPKEPCHGRN